MIPELCKRMLRREPATTPAPAVPQPLLAESLQALKALAPPAWLPDIDRALAKAAEREWGLVWEFLQRAGDSAHGTEFGIEAARLAPRAQQLEALSWPPPRPAPPPPEGPKFEPWW